MPYAREVDKDVNPIVADQLDQCFISQPLGFALVIRVCAHALGITVQIYVNALRSRQFKMGSKKCATECVRKSPGMNPTRIGFD
jgi:hypothetical protein